MHLFIKIKWVAFGITLQILYNGELIQNNWSCSVNVVTLLQLLSTGIEQSHLSM